MNEWMNEWMNEYVYLSLKQNFYNEIQLDSTQSCIIVKNICPCGFSKVI